MTNNNERERLEALEAKIAELTKERDDWSITAIYVTAAWYTKTYGHLPTAAKALELAIDQYKKVRDGYYPVVAAPAPATKTPSPPPAESH